MTVARTIRIFTTPDLGAIRPFRRGLRPVPSAIGFPGAQTFATRFQDALQDARLVGRRVVFKLLHTALVRLAAAGFIPFADFYPRVIRVALRGPRFSLNPVADRLPLRRFRFSRTSFGFHGHAALTGGTSRREEKQGRKDQQFNLLVFHFLPQLLVLEMFPEGWHALPARRFVGAHYNTVRCSSEARR